MLRNGKKIIIIVIVMLCTMMLFGCQENQNVNKTNNEFKYCGDFADLSLIKEDLDDNTIFLLGEYHGIRDNCTLKKEFIKYIKENTNFKYLLSEHSPADSYLNNKYLQTGDITIIDDMYKNLKGTFAWTKDSYEFLQWLYNYNQMLPLEDRIMFIGSDIVHQQGTALKVLQEILNNTDTPKEIKEEVDKLKDLECYGFSIEEQDREKLVSNSKLILDKIESNEKIYSDVYSKDYIYLHGILKGIVLGDGAYKADDNDFNKIRDKAMYEIFNIFYENIPNGKYFGQWGEVHCYQESLSGEKWFATYLNEDNRFKDKIVSAMIVYEDCKMMNKTSNLGYCEIDFDNTESTDTIEDKENILYKIDGNDSTIVQYFIKLKNSPATKPFGE